ncbi:MAG: hypothetical protein IJX16_06990, partial [Clostridia bacterium]|nr:hypothetical protein [Clostridia bacterium]
DTDIEDRAIEEEVANTIIEVDTDVVEMLGSETLLYCKLRKPESEVVDENSISIVDDVHNLVAKVDSRAKVERGQRIKVAIDMTHCHLFDKETEMTIVARDADAKKAYLDAKAEAAAAAEVVEEAPATEETVEDKAE